MKLKMIFCCLILVLIFFSCKKDNLATTVDSAGSTNLLLSKVLVNNQSAYEYIYNDTLLTEEKSKYNYTLNQYNTKGQLVTTVYYGNDNVLSSDLPTYTTAVNSTVWVTAANGTKGGTVTYDYNDNNLLIKTTYSLTSSSSTEYSAFTYDANNRIIRQIMYWNNVVTGYIDYSYDSNGNLTKEMLYNQLSTTVAELITTTTYDFDNKSNPYKSSCKSVIPGIKSNKNNITKETYTIHLSSDMGGDNVQVTAVSYEYNDSGFPISKSDNTTYVYM